LIPLEFTTTAMNRPEIVYRTYKSFKDRLLGVDWPASKVYINVDPAPTGERSAVVDAVERATGAKVVFRFPEKCNYSDAYKWLWRRSKGEYFFNLEDDWELCEEVQIKSLVDKLMSSEKHVAVPLRAYQYFYKSTPTSPSLYKTLHFRDVSYRMSARQNPETQLHDIMKTDYESGKAIHPKDRTCLYPFGSNRVVVRDIGREWLENSEYTRPQLLNDGDPRKVKKCHFTGWVKK
jgi:hypothetical protein